jgi:hypothetical protein
MEENVTTTTALTTRAVGVRYGIISGIISIAYFLILTTAGIDTSKGFGFWGGMLIGFIIMFLAHKYYKENGDGFMSYGQGIGIGFWIGLVSAAISSTFTFIYATLIDPSFIPNIREKAIADMEAKGQTQTEIDRAMPFVDMFMSPVVITLMGLFFGILITVVIALIISIFTQKPQPEQSI